MNIKTYSKKVTHAIEFATKAHEGQLRRDSITPYIVHPIDVGEIVMLAGGDEAQICAGILHDVIEDCDVTLIEIIENFGNDVASLVDDLTNKSKRSDGNRAFRKSMDRERISKIPTRAKLVKLADVLSNTKSIKQIEPRFAKVYLDEVALLLEVLQDAGPFWKVVHAEVHKALRKF